MITDTIMLNMDHIESLNISFIINNYLLKHYKF